MDPNRAPLLDPLFTPAYTPARQGDWDLRLADLVVGPGYWSPPRHVPKMAALTRGGLAWMSMTPMELESQEIGVRLAHGHVVIFGLGMGWAAAASAMIPRVSGVTVVERDPDVLEMHRRLAIFDQLPEAARAKIEIVEDDALTWTARRPVDLLMPDIWQPLVSDDRVAEVGRMQANVRASAIYFWGQEMEIARLAVAAARGLDAAGIAATIADMGLPLVGPGFPDYAALLEAAARRWMRGRWLPGTTPPF